MTGFGLLISFAAVWEIRGVESITELRKLTALVVRGGWEGHCPVETTDSFLPFLEKSGYQTVISDTLDFYLDADLIAATDLILQCWTMGRIVGRTRRRAVGGRAGGTGLAGWHGGIVDAFRGRPEYLQLVGGQFAAHPGGIRRSQRRHRARAAPTTRSSPVCPIASTCTPSSTGCSADDLDDVLATTTIRGRRHLGPSGDLPAVWTRRWGCGRVFVCTVGHAVEDLLTPEIRTIVRARSVVGGRMRIGLVGAGNDQFGAYAENARPDATIAG